MPLHKKRKKEVLTEALCKNCYILGEFNLDAGMSDRHDYLSRHSVEKLENLASNKNLIQIVNFDTWS